MKRTPQDEKVTTQEDVARLAGVTRSVVSYVLNNSIRKVAPKTRKRVLEAIEELNYRPNKHAQQLMKVQHGKVADRQFGIVLSDVFMLKRPYYSDILAGINRTAHEQHHHIRFMRFFPDLKNPLIFNELVHEEEISGLILIALDQSIKNEDDQKIISQIKDRIENIVCIDWEYPGIASIRFDRHDACYTATKHLISLGHREIHYIGQQDRRTSGYQQAIAEHQLDSIISISNGNMSDGYLTMKSLILQNTIPRAIMAGCDEIAFGIIRALSEKNIRIPEQVALAGIDNIEMSEYTNPPLTTIQVDTGSMGSYAVHTLMNLSANPEKMIASSLLPTELIIRSSSRVDN